MYTHIPATPLIKQRYWCTIANSHIIPYL